MLRPFIFKVHIQLYFAMRLASRTFAHRTLAHSWHFIDACQVNRPV